MKKLFSLLLCVVMVLSLVACGSKTDDTQTPDEPQDTAPELSGTMKVVATGDVYGPLVRRVHRRHRRGGRMPVHVLRRGALQAPRRGRHPVR